MQDENPVLRRMHKQLTVWEKGGDRRAIFLGCYSLMTRNMYQALCDNRFGDGDWVRRWLEYFAGYYFSAMVFYEKRAPNVPKPWKMAFDAALDPQTTVLQHLLLGINAHINFDLILALSNILRKDWPNYSDAERQAIYVDFCTVNTIISETIDIVEDSVIKPKMPIYGIADNLLGPINEWITKEFIAHWRDRVWNLATTHAGTVDPAQINQQVKYFEDSANSQARLFLLSDFTGRFTDLK